MSPRPELPLWRRWSGPRGRDVAIVVLTALGSLAGAGNYWVNAGHGAGITAAVCGLLGAALLWWRRRWPLMVTLVGGILDLVGAASLVVGFGLLTIAVRRRDRTLILYAAYTAAVYSAPYLWGDATWNQSNVIAGVAGAVVWSLFGAYVGARRDLLASLRERAARAESERELRGEQARTAERARIAREMHDVLAHKVSLIALQAGALEVNADQGSVAVERAAAQIRTTARDTLEDLRGVLGVLRSASDGVAFAPQPGLADLIKLVEDSHNAGVQVDLMNTVDPAAVPDALGRTVYRIAQEGLTNVHKHARGARTTVQIVPDGSGLEVSVTNQRPVASGSLLPGSGAGLVGLRERVALAGGSLEAGPTADGGWRVAAWLPVPAALPRTDPDGSAITAARHGVAAGSAITTATNADAAGSAITTATQPDAAGSAITAATCSGIDDSSSGDPASTGPTAAAARQESAR